MRRIVTLFAAALGLAAYLSSPVVARAQIAPPTALNFQGRLTTPSGNPVPDGTYSVRFRFYDSAAGTTVVYEQTIASVAVRNGTFAVLITGFTADKFDGNTWVGIKIGDDAELTPRTQVVSVPYAIKSNLALTVPDGSITAAKLASGVLNFSSLGGSISPGQIPDNSIGSAKLATDVASLGKLTSGIVGTVNGQLSVPGGVIKNGTANLGVNELGLFSQINGRQVTFVTTSAPFVWYTDGGIGSNASMTLTNLGVLSVNSTTTSFPTMAVTAPSTVGTWLQLNNTSTGGNNWNIISSGSGNGEGAGRLLFNNQSVGGTRMILDTTGVRVIGTLTATSLPFGDYRNVQWNDATGQFFYDNSSRKHKRNISPLVDDFDLLLKAQPVTYTRPNAPGRWEIGFIAEDFDALGLKKLVDYSKDGDVEGINYEKICLYLTAIAKKQSVTIQNQGQALENQRMEIEQLKAQMEKVMQLLERERR